MNTSVKSLIVGLSVLSFPVAALAGGSLAWNKQQADALPAAIAEAAAQPGTAPSRVLSSADLGMHFSHGPGKANSSTRIAVPGTEYIVETPTESSHPFNKRALIMELKEDQVKGAAM